MLSYWPCQRLNVAAAQPAPPPRLARGAHKEKEKAVEAKLVHRLASTAFSFSLSALC